MSNLRYTAAVLAILVLPAILAVFIESYRFGDCKRVGHGTLYCILNIGR